MTPGGKVLYVFRVRDAEIFGFAGLYEESADDEQYDQQGQQGTLTHLPTRAIITMRANALVASIHDRMPVIFKSREDEQRWLDPDVVEAEQVIELL